MSESTYNTATIAPLTLDHAAPDAPSEAEELFTCHFTFEGLMGGWSALREAAEACEPWHADPQDVAVELNQLADTYKALASMTTTIMQMEEKTAGLYRARQAVTAATEDVLRRAEGRAWDA